MSLRSTSCTMFVALLAWATLPLAGQTTNPALSNSDTNYVQPSTASSSIPAPAPDTGENKPATWEVFLGYSWMNSNSVLSGVKNVGSPPTPVPVTEKLKDARGGFLVDVSYFFNRWFGIKIDTGAHFGNNYDYDEAVIGPTIRFPAEHIQPFIEVMGGWTRLSPGFLNPNDVFGLIGGGGLDLKVAKHLNIRLAQADYIYAQHNYGVGNPRYVDNVRLSAGLVFLGGVGEELPVSATCSVTPTEIWAGEPVKASVATQHFNPKHTLKYDWTTNGGKLSGSGDNVTIDTTGLPEDGKSYTVSVQVSDPKNKKAVATCPAASFTVKKRQPPTISCSANPNTAIQGGAITIHSDANSPQGGPVTVAVTSDCGVQGQGNDVNVDTSSLQPGSCNVTCTVTDDHQLTATSTTTFTVQPKPTPTPTPPPNLVLRSVYFATAQPTVKNPNGGLVKSQEATLTEVASEFVKYLQAKPDAKLVLEAHADPRGGVEYNQKLTERRAARAKDYLVGQGVPADSIETRAFGEQHQLTPDEVRKSMDDDPTLTANERKRLERNMRLITLAANRRVDIKVEAPGVPEQLSQRRYPFAAADALTLIGGRERPKAAPKAPTKKTTRKPARKTKK